MRTIVADQPRALEQQPIVTCAYNGLPDRMGETCDLPRPRLARWAGIARRQRYCSWPGALRPSQTALPAWSSKPEWPRSSTNRSSASRRELRKPIRT